MLNDKVAIITGASSGIGYATALALSKAGAKVAIGARRTDKLADLENKIKENGGEVYSQKLDVTKKDECNSFVNNVLEKWGSVDILVNNAGLMPLSFVKNLKIDEWDQMVDVNIKGVLYCTGAVVSHMLEKKSGHIVNISSVAGRIVFPAGSVYRATKHAITAFSEPVEFSKVLFPLIIQSLAKPTMNQFFLSTTVIFTSDEESEFLISFAVDKPPNPPPKIKT